ncbi:MAG TPA: endonuclease/exonuclease/phosphatase family protein [Bryobacteraceae bacterium]|nr:endonuclease/exonuclease/phosphatase family protein [Bryobacteraceae bacterium]
MTDIVTGNFARFPWQFWPPQALRVVNWNIDRGLRLAGIIDFLDSQRADLITLQEADLHAKRTHYLNIAEQIARKLEMNYVFGREFQELTQGSRISPAFHGQATLSRWRLREERIIRFRRQSDFWRPRWYLPETKPFQERLGGRIALVTEVDAVGRSLIVYNVHLESRGNETLRIAQLAETLNDARDHAATALLVAGDLNFNVLDGSAPELLDLAGLRSVFGESHLYTRPARLFGSPRTIDWALISEGMEAEKPQVHSDIGASDHYPISFTLRFV